MTNPQQEQFKGIGSQVTECGSTGRPRHDIIVFQISEGYNVTTRFNLGWEHSSTHPLRPHPMIHWRYCIQYAVICQIRHTYNSVASLSGSRMLPIMYEALSRCRRNFAFDVQGSVHRKRIPEHNQQDETLHSLFISVNCSTSVGYHVHHQEHKTVSTASVNCLAVTATCRYRGRVSTLPR
jgi:hypothetical protein